MDGILVIDKPAGITSHDVVARVRRILGTKRVGHTGTLDPFATGVLVLLVGKATRLAQFLDKDRKEYIAEIQFGSSTATGDNTGTVIDGSESHVNAIAEVLTSGLQAALKSFRGDLMQTPPMYSAKKVGGKKLYEFAREGKTIDRAPVPISVYELSIVDDEWLEEEGRLELKVACSAGTYVRTLAEDIGASMGIGAHLVALRRIAAGEFELGQSVTLDALQEMSDPRTALLPLDRAVSNLAEQQLSDDRVEKTRGGLSTRVNRDEFVAGQNVRLVDESKQLIAIGVYDSDEKSVKPKIVLV